LAADCERLAGWARPPVREVESAALDLLDVPAVLVVLVVLEAVDVVDVRVGRWP
jgi:hypothetical protein